MAQKAPPLRGQGCTSPGPWTASSRLSLCPSPTGAHSPRVCSRSLGSLCFLCVLLPVGCPSLTHTQARMEAKPSLHVADTRPCRALPVSPSSATSSILGGGAQTFLSVPMSWGICAKRWIPKLRAWNLHLGSLWGNPRGSPRIWSFTNHDRAQSRCEGFPAQTLPTGGDGWPQPWLDFCLLC